MGHKERGYLGKEFDPGGEKRRDSK